MNTRHLLSAVLFASLLALNTGAAETKTKSTAPTDAEVKANFDQVNVKIRDGKKTPEDLAAEVKVFDDLIAARRATEPEKAAYAAYLKATLFIAVFKDIEAGNAMLKAIPADFPGTYYGQRAQASLDAQVQREKADAEYAIGKKFPDFAERDLDGKPLSLAALKGKVVLVDFWATWCGPCIGELPNIKTAYEKHHAAGFEIVGISLDSDRKKLTDFLAKN